MFQPFLRFWLINTYLEDRQRKSEVSTLLEILDIDRLGAADVVEILEFQPFLRFWKIYVDILKWRWLAPFQPFLRFWLQHVFHHVAYVRWRVSTLLEILEVFRPVCRRVAVPRYVSTLLEILAEPRRHRGRPVAVAFVSTLLEILDSRKYVAASVLCHGGFNPS